VAHKHVSDVVPAPSSVVPELPPSLDALVALATSRDPDLRPADAGQFLRAISEVRGGMPIGGGAHAAGGSADAHPAGASFPFFEQDGQTAHFGYGPEHGGGYGPEQGSGPGGKHSLVPARYSPTPGNEYSPVPASDYGQSPDQDGMNHTLVVPSAGLPADGIPFGGLPYSEGDGPDTRRRGGYRRRGEPVLQRWLFSRRFVYMALALGVALIVGLIAWWVTDGQFVTVPQVSEMAASTARTELQNLGFTVRVGHSQHNNNVAKGDIIKTDPAIGTSAKRGAVVTMIVSTGPVMITVPQVTGLTQAAAESALKKAGLTPGQVSSAASSTIGLGVVISTNPVANTSWPQDKPVGLTVSAGPPLPNLVGQQFTDAQGEAQSGGYQLQEQADANSTQPAGTITGQQPAAGTPISQGEVVTVQVSSGPPEVAIPDVAGDTVADATAALEAAGFQVTGNGLGRVVGTTPSGEAPKGSTVALVLTIPFP
jgi:serine/threonine-protein kinase